MISHFVESTRKKQRRGDRAVLSHLVTDSLRGLS